MATRNPSLTGTVLAVCLVVAATVTATVAADPEPFEFDFYWLPQSPRVNDTVHFYVDQSQGGARLPEDRFRWYKRLPRSGYQLFHIGSSFDRPASYTYFEGTYKLEVSLQPVPSRLHSRSEADNGTRKYVEVVKYVSVQSRVHSLLLVDGRSLADWGDAGPSITGKSPHNLTCRFWGNPQLHRMHFQPPMGANCTGQFSEQEQDKPYIDLVTQCWQLELGMYVCSGGNSLGEWQLHCELQLRFKQPACYQLPPNTQLRMQLGSNAQQPGKSSHRPVATAEWRWLCLALTLLAIGQTFATA